MTAFHSFIESIKTARDGNEGKASQGKAFEHFCKWFLSNDPFWKTQVDKVWLWNEWPERWGPDCGIDLIFKHKNGELWAVQAKCYDAAYAVSKASIDSFLSESNRPRFKHRLLMASTDKISKNAVRASVAQEKPVTLYMRKDFEAANVSYPTHISQLSTARPKAKPTPDPHQKSAVNDVVKGFADRDRGQLIMACGTGKTFITLWIKEAMAAQTTLVLAPSLNLLSQTVSAWTFAGHAGNSSFAVLCVCSDKTVGQKDAEDMSVIEAPFPVTSDSCEIAAFLKSDGPKVVFCTYQSSALIVEAQEDNAVQPFDLVIADEAHRCSGKSDAAFSQVLDDKKIHANKRLFATATPRLYASNVKKAAADRGIKVYGMDDEVIFGPRFHTLTFGQAINKGLLDNYQVVIVGVDEPMVKAWIDNQALLLLGPDHYTDARTLAAKIGFLKAIKDYDLKRVISFHSRVKSARGFVSEIAHVMGSINTDHRPAGRLWASYVEGSMSTADRLTEITKLKSLADADRGLLANARCLSEGVDVPSLDGIAFIDPKGSQIDIIQAVGRAIRKVRGDTSQKKSTIVLPVFIADGDNAQAQIAASNFKPIWDVLKALRSHDDVLAEHLDRYRSHTAESSGRLAENVDDRIIFDLPTTIDPHFASALRTVLVEATTASWFFWYGLLTEYKTHNNDCNVPTAHKIDGYALGVWVANQRTAKQAGNLSPDRVSALDELGFAWDAHETNWQEGHRHLTTFVEDKGHARVPTAHKIDGYPLGWWVSTQRTDKQAGKLSPARVSALDELGFVWDPHETNWQEGYRHLKSFVEDKGHARVPNRHKTDDGYALGGWVSNQRKANQAGKLSLDRVSALNKLGFVWDPYQAYWQEGYRHLTTFVEDKGHARVPNSHKTADDYTLGVWVATQRVHKQAGKLSPARVSALNKLGFVWDELEAKWWAGFKHFKAFVEDKGHARVPRAHKIDGYTLGWWVGTQRKDKQAGKLSPDRVSALDELGFVWDTYEAYWQDGYRHLTTFVDKEGHARVPQGYKTADGYALGVWVGRQRAAKQADNLSPARKEKLDDIGFIWDPHEAYWQEGHRHLTTFVDKEGHASVPHGYKTTDGYALGVWVANQRAAKQAGSLSPARVSALDKLGFVWDQHEAYWQEGYRHLKSFVEDKGHARVPRAHKIDGYALGVWVANQRADKQAGKLSPDREEKLDKLGFVWDAQEAKWQEGYRHLTTFVKDKGHARVFNRHKIDGYTLGSWVGKQRKAKQAGKLSPARVSALDELGFVWDPLEANWQEGHSHLTAFVKNEGHASVPRAHKIDGYPLGMWVSNQRKAKQAGKLSPARKEKLDDIGFIWDARPEKKKRPPDA